LTILAAISPRRPGSANSAKKRRASPTGNAVISGRLRSATNTWRAAAFSRVPPQSGQGRVLRYLASSSRTIGFGLPVAALQVGHDALEGMAAGGERRLRLVGVLELDLLLAAAVQHDPAHPFRQLLEGGVDVEP
jgi:hypothetical protein